MFENILENTKKFVSISSTKLDKLWMDIFLRQYKVEDGVKGLF